MSSSGTSGLCRLSGDSTLPSQTVLVTNELASTSIAVSAVRYSDLPRPAPVLGPGAQFHACTRDRDRMVVRLSITAVNGSAPGLPYERMLGYPAAGDRSMAFDIHVTPSGVRFDNV
ncbi:hypothetical protein pdul_cds_472 [Pandoravirus dulcis]|uniref:Uncharacterized protein n=1 Tax=Pandoravirus dulcis TaxID=1349409 RepID=S4VQC6_9VIRU|nr:hypothetical protein pdul_cds_472 [Pandoravirus dulcis]AGO82548.1 hypothetical protein pdul_cds_472 [Pandoravirus dulcis]